MDRRDILGKTGENPFKGLPYDTPAQSQALGLLANRGARFDPTIAEKGWKGITEEQRAWAIQAWEDQRDGKPFPG